VKIGLWDKSFEKYVSYFLSLCYIDFFILIVQAYQSFELHEHSKLNGARDYQMWKHRLKLMLM
jgi:hypothetical protein